MDAAGHQIGSHTWSHADLGTITTTTAHNQMRTLEIELWKILGKYPTYMRPPYFSCGANCRTVMKQLGYHIIFASVDTKDFENNTPSTNTIAQQNFNRAISAGNPRTSSFNVLSHDVHETTVTMLTKYMLDRIRTLGYRGEPLLQPRLSLLDMRC